MNVKLAAPNNFINGNIYLEGSKSLSNRLLILQALSEDQFEIENLSPSDDTNTLKEILQQPKLINNVGAAGTTMRFLTAYFSILSGERILTGSERMKQRPLKVLVDALKSVGAEIEYLEKEGFPPIKIVGKELQGSKIQINSNISSQYISAILMISPFFKNGFTMELIGKISSKPYIQMTLDLMSALQVETKFENNVIHVYPGKYRGENMKVESDWSAASYYFSICSFKRDAEINIHGLFEKSLQGDSILPSIYQSIGVESKFDQQVLKLKKINPSVEEFEFDFSNCPDLAQSVVVSCAGLGIEGRFSGLESLKIKETNRTEALKNELSKFNVQFFQEGDIWLLKGKTETQNSTTHIQTYEDHRMAMCFAPLSLKHENIIIEDALVVNKSYPSFWDDLKSLGFSVSSDF